MGINYAKLSPFVLGALLLAGALRFPVAHPHLLARPAQQYVAEIALALVVAGLVFVGANRWAGALIVSAIVSTYYPMYDMVSALAMPQWLMMGMWYFACYRLKNDDLIFDGICLVALLNYVFSLMQLLFINDPGDAIPACGLMTNPNEAAALAAIAIPAFMRFSCPSLEIGSRRFELPVAWAWGIPLMVHNVVLSKSFGAALALAAGVGFMVFVRGNKSVDGFWRFPLRNRAGSLMVFCVLAGLLAYLAVDKPESEGVRLAAWAYAWKILQQFPVFGIGLGHWPSTFPVIPHPTQGIPLYFDSAHNDYIQLVYEHGFKAAPILLGFIAALLWRARKHIDEFSVQRLNMAVIICLTSACYHWLFQNGTTAPIAVAYFAMLDKETK